MKISVKCESKKECRVETIDRVNAKPGFTVPYALATVYEFEFCLTGSLVKDRVSGGLETFTIVFPEASFEVGKVYEMTIG